MGLPNEQQAEKALRRDLGLYAAMSIVIGSVIGSGIFVKPGKVIDAAGDSSMALVAWILGGILTIASGLTIAELGSRIPKTGGLYTYLEELYGEIWGYLCGWVQTLIYGPAIIGALGLFFGSLMAHLFGWDKNTILPIGIITVVLLASINILGAKYGGRIQVAATAGKLIPITLIAVCGLLFGNEQILNMPSGTTVHAGMGAAILATLWAYDGWLLVAFVAGEIPNPAKVLPQAIIIGLSVVMLAYLGVNLAVMHVLPADQIVALNTNAASVAAEKLFGTWGGKLISVGILVSIFGCLNGKILSFPRVTYAMAIRGQLPAAGVFAKVHPQFATPINSIILQICIAILLMFVSDPDHLSDIAIFVIYCFYIFAFVGLFKLRKQEAAPGTYKVPLFPFVPIVAIIGALYICLSTVIDQPMDVLWAFVITLTGLPVYWLFIKKKA